MSENENDLEELEEDEDINSSPMAEENKKILQSKNYESDFHNIFLELLDIGKGYHKAKESFTDALLKTVSQENPQNVYQYMDFLTQRFESIHVIKRLCALYGLHDEMDRILEHEMMLIYSSPNRPAPKLKSDDRSMPIAGEHSKV